MLKMKMNVESIRISGPCLPVGQYFHYAHMSNVTISHNAVAILVVNLDTHFNY